MTIGRILVVAAFAAVLALPFVVRLDEGGAGGGHGRNARATGAGVPRLIVVTPHVEQIRQEFGAVFSAWRQRRFGTPAAVDWRAPGGTSEIVKQLEAQFTAAAKAGLFRVEEGVPVCPPGTIGYDVFLGGGSYEHGRVADGVRVVLPGDEAPTAIPMSVPAGFSQAQLDEWFGENRIGVQKLYDPEQFWLGTALSGFGIVYNRDVLGELGLPEPTSFRDLTAFEYFNLLALADPRMSGSVTTTYESILNNEGWDQGWRILRDMAANARYFATSSTRPPIDVSQGDAAAGLAIDFYGRGQAQEVMAPGETAATSRVGYVDPAGAVYIDADPVSILRGAPHPELAREFVEFLLTDEAQALWQMRPDAANPIGKDGRPMGPERYELRRMPVKRSMYGPGGYMPYFVDQVNPFELASDVAPRGWRSGIAPMLAAFGIDTSDELKRAWVALNGARRDPAFPPERLAAMEALFYAMPPHTMKDGATVIFSEATYKAVKEDTNSWRDPEHGRRALIGYAAFFRANYRRVVEMAEER